MKTAKDFCLDYYKQKNLFKTILSKMNKSLIENIHPSFANDPRKDNILKGIREFVPTYSDDIRMENIFKDILSNSNDELQLKLHNVFIATHYDADMQAFIQEARGSYTGSIIFMSWGLTSAIIEYSVLLAMFYEYLSTDYSKKRKELEEVFLRRVNNIAKGQMYWRKYGFDGSSEHCLLFSEISDEVFKMHTLIFMETAKFVLCHELAHTILGHLSNKKKALSEYFTILFTDVLASTEKHQIEFQADVFSLFLSAGAYRENKSTISVDFKFNIPQALGALLAFTIFGQQNANMHEDSESHPSLEKRISILKNSLKALMSPDDLMFSKGLINALQRILYKTQGLGLGKNISKEYDVI